MLKLSRIAPILALAFLLPVAACETEERPVEGVEEVQPGMERDTLMPQNGGMMQDQQQGY